jgi:AraC-like DNA-binding protein
LIDLKQGTGLWRKTILRWLSAYVLVVVLVVILVALISAVTLNTVESSARIEQQIKMENLRASMDVLLVDVDRALTQISADERLNVLCASTPPYTPYQLYMLYDLNRSFPRQIAVPGPWSSVYVYIKRGGFILFTGGKFDLPSAYRLLDYALSAEAWQERLDGLRQKVFVANTSASEAERTYLEYWFPVGSGQENSGVLVARLNMTEFKDRLSAMRSVNDEILLLLDERGHVLFSTAPPDEALAQTIAQTVTTTDTFVETDGLVIGHARSQLSGWTYVSILPKDFLFSRSVYTRQIAWALCVFLLVVGLLLSILAVLQNYRPIKRLYDLARQNSPENGSSDAYGFLETSIRDLMKKNDQAAQTLQQYQNLLRQDVLLRLISGARVESESLQSAQVQFRSNRFVAFLASCDNAEDLFFGEYNNDAHSLSLVAMSDVLQKTFGGELDVYTLEHEDQIVGVIGLPEDYKEERLLGLAHEGQQVLKSQMGLSITLVLSDIQSGLENIATAYEHARETLECELLVSSERGALLCYQLDKGDGSYVMDLETSIAFSRAVKKRDFAQAKELVNRVIETYLSSPHPAPDMARVLMFTLANTMLDAMRTAEAPFDEVFLKSLRPAQRMAACASIRELRTEMERIIDESENYALQLRSNQGKYINGIKTFVQEKYIDANMNVSGIAQEMGMSVSTLSKLFKKKTDMGLLNYINHIRIEQACQLLTTTDLTLSEIAEKTGFLNSSTLIRNFKRTMGVTPGKYKLENGRIHNDRR